MFEGPAAIQAPVSDGTLFAVRRVFCIGRNYAAHAREMGKDPDREAPFFFTKWAETVVPSGTVIAYPPETTDFHYEAELVVVIGHAGRRIEKARALEHVFGYAAGLDMTRRDLQLEARDKGRPWDAGKNVEQSSPLGTIQLAESAGTLDRSRISLTVNGETKQDASLGDLIWSVPEVIAYVSRFYRLEPGDLIYTGTPAGVGPVVTGDMLTVTITGLTPLNISIGPADD